MGSDAILDRIEAASYEDEMQVFKEWLSENAGMPQLLINGRRFDVETICPEWPHLSVYRPGDPTGNGDRPSIRRVVGPSCDGDILMMTNLGDTDKDWERITDIEIADEYVSLYKEAKAR